MKSLKAFTLLEVMVALVVISVTMGAIISSAASSTAVASRLKEKTVANWVAQNQIALYRAKKIWTTSTSNQNGKDMPGQCICQYSHLGIGLLVSNIDDGFRASLMVSNLKW